ncbi:MAG TPA: erythromycin esterase family protein, partial [Nannocystaceae bacterium]|nr:erythromycin esterase family protein [Nannocystaceae bacterium]
VDWLLAQAPERKIVLWAHNAHVQISEPAQEWMGEHLHRTHGDEMVVFGFAFHRGSFTARDSKSPMLTLRSFTVGPARADSAESLLASTRHAALALDLRQLAPDTPAHTWFANAVPTRGVGSVFFEGADALYYEPQVLPERFDALLFVADTTASRTNASADRALAELHDTPTNLDFEQGATGWDARGKEALFGFDVAVTEDSAHTGKLGARISRTGGVVVGSYGKLVQHLAPAAYVGKTLRMRAAVRASTAGIGNRAYLFVRVHPKWGSMDPPRQAVAPIVNDAWKPASLRIAIPENAGRITFGIALVGNGTVSLDDVSIEAKR